MEENKIIKCLKAFPAGDIYYLSPKLYVIQGFDYYREGRLIHLNWSKDYQVLTAKVQGGQIYSITFSADKERLKFECNCHAWSPSLTCEHTICALLTIKNILNPSLFSIGKDREGYRKSLESSLMSFSGLPEKESPADIKTPVYSVVLEKNRYSGLPGIFVEEGGRPVSHHHYYDLPEELRNIARSSQEYYIDQSKTILEYLKKKGGMYPLFLKIKDRRIPVEWDASLVFSSKTEIDVTRDTVTFKRLCIFKDNVCMKPYLLGDNFIVDLETGKLGIIGNRKGWGIWNLFAESLMRTEYDTYADAYDWEIYHEGEIDDGQSNGISIPVKMFQDMQFTVPDENKAVLQDILLKVDKQGAPLTKAGHSYSMTIDKHSKEKGRMILRACCNLEGFSDSTTKFIFAFLPFIQNSYSISPSLRAQKRWTVLVRTFLGLLSTGKKGEADKIIRESLSSGDFTKHVVKREAKRYLNDAFSLINMSSSRIQFYNGQWYITGNDKEKEALLYTIPFELFGVDIFKGMRTHHEMTVNAVDLYRHLPTLYLKLKEEGIPLFYKGKSVVSSRWDFTFDASRDSGIDWFEIKPEIRCDGKLIDDASWQRALEQNGVIEKGDIIQILDSNTHEILREISAIQEGVPSAGRMKEIVRVPRLKILDWIHLRSKGVEVRLSREDEALIERLNRFEKIEERPLPERLKAKLRPYQREGYYWLSFLYEHRFGACLADDMGLGKTLEAITLLAGIKEGKVKPHSDYLQCPHLVVVPPSLLFNWENEINRFYPDLKIHLYSGKERHTDFKDCDIVLTTYGLVRRDIEKLKEVSFHVMIFDEAQTVKNIYADTTGAVRQLRGYFKLTMTGTPLENHLGEYYSILDLSLPGLLGEYDDFKSYIKMETSPFIDLILRRTRPFVLRRTKEKILKELPPKMESDIYLELTDRQKVLYKKTVERVRSTIADAYERKTNSQAQIIALTAILKLRQMCVSPRLIDPAIDEPSPKIEFLIGKLKELLAEGHNALVFSQFTSFLDILEEDLKSNEIPFYRLDGSTAVRKRKGLVEGFQSDERASIFLLSLKAGGQGLNLTRASYVFHLDPWWNPAVENQASDRAHRIGQKNKVTITRILMRHTVEEKMMELKKKKLALYKAVMEDSMHSKKGLSVSRSDFDYLLD